MVIFPGRNHYLGLALGNKLRKGAAVTPFIGYYGSWPIFY